MINKYTTIQLDKLVDIRSGHAFRSKLEHTPLEWNYTVLQLKDVQKDGAINLNQATQLKISGEKAPQPLRIGDILLRARGGYYYSGLFTAEAPNVIAAGPFFILTPDTDKTDPAYLCWFLNQQGAQQYFNRNDSGSNIAMISKQTISELPVTLPSLATQHKIAKVHQSWLKEKKVSEQLISNREKMVRGLCQHYINLDFKH